MLYKKGYNYLPIYHQKQEKEDNNCTKVIILSIN